MRIIAGKWGGRRLEAPEGRETRPTSDRVREALFSALGQVGGLRVLDLFAGTGALGLEALSRGASSAVFVEQGRPALRSLQANVRALAAQGEVEVLGVPVKKALRSLPTGAPFCLVFADPPYAALGEAIEALEVLARLPDALSPEALAVLEHASRDPSPRLDGWELQASRAYGDSALSRYQREGAR
jgi:16S rRNA (guanine966-N2)-methyltransferase